MLLSRIFHALLVYKSTLKTQASCLHHHQSVLNLFLMTDSSNAAFNICAIAIVGTLNIVYNFVVLIRSRGSCGNHSLHAVVVNGGTAFIQRHLEKDDPASAVLAVQSLRNTVLVSIFIGGIAFQSFQAAAVSAAVVSNDSVATARTLVLSAFLLSSFLNFALVIRAASHLAYIMGGASSQHTPPLLVVAHSSIMAEEGRGGGGGGGGGGSINVSSSTAASTTRAAHLSRTTASFSASLMRALTLHFSLGFRCLYASVPFAYAAAGPIPLVVSATLMFMFLFYADFAMHNDQSQQAEFNNEE